jgi:hypothetical protein
MGLTGYEYVAGVMHPCLKVGARASRLILGLAFFATVLSIGPVAIGAVELSGLSSYRGCREAVAEKEFPWRSSEWAPSLRYRERFSGELFGAGL